MDDSRRSFLKKAGYSALGLSCGLPLFGAGCSALRQEPAAEPSTSQLAMIIDVRKCLQEDIRRACIEACRRAHNLPEIPDPNRRIQWIRAEKYENVFPDQVHAHTEPAVRQSPILVLCNHCTHPPCVKVCPTKATWKRQSDGVVMMDMHRCIGCRYCMAACPYGARSFNWSDPRKEDENGRLVYFENGEPPTSEYPTRSKGVVEKCTFCAERLRYGLPPACVEAANQLPAGKGALTFGRLDDPEITRILKEKHSICRRVDLGTGPNVFYIA